jgi:predicted ATPase
VAGSGTPDWQADGRAIRLIRHDPAHPVDVSRWPVTVPAVEQLLCEGLELPAGVTVLVGENGSHSPIVAAVPGASILELGDWGIRATRWEELHLVGAWRRFLTEPDSYFRHLLAD